MTGARNLNHQKCIIFKYFMKPRRGPSISYKITYFTSCTNILPLKHLFYLFSFPVDLISEEDFKEVAVLAGPKTGFEQL